MTNALTTTVHAEVPARLLTEIQALVDAGWSRSLDDVVADALRRYVESHHEPLMEELLREDVEWGLRGRD